MNGALSVTGSVLTRVISVSAGFTVVLLCVAGLYLAAALLYRANEAQAPGARALPQGVSQGRPQVPQAFPLPQALPPRAIAKS